MSLSRTRLLREMGISPVWRLRGRPDDDAAVAAAADDAVPAAAAGNAPASPAAVAIDAGSVAGMDWPALRAAVAGCTACGLCRERKQAVLGVGDERADWLFIGEGPGAEEDARGEPFVGQAGKLLDAMLAAIDLARGDNVYIANAVKCRPPGNRTPEPAEMAACRPYLQRQIALLRPKLIVLLGRAAMHAVLGEERPLGASRGRLFEYRDGELVVPVLVTYHPAYLLRNLPDKAKAWEDLLFARRTMRRQLAEG
ncbi:uracil-DNA glycosylase [Azospira restricta]|uniref:Type-4 uracil-DNA glycosylase n=1 Tax=Azospira restricta TaxID=404405 RepID=A0A974PX07_9RHOO|nr:uracil-DNA glycosylase [Azospira restricta]QRJ62866.1 uracil-DNA glycosylase [Azospira restricta]